MKLLSVASAKWNNTQQTSLDCQATFDTGTIPYTANEGDASTAAVWAMATAGTVAPYIAPTPPAPTKAQLGAAALAAGLTINCTSAPTINGTYSLSPSAQAAYDSVTTYINTKGTFPRAMTTTSWPDITGVLHVFPSTAVFIEFAAAMADFVDAVDDYVNGVAGSSIPTATTTIP